MRLFRRVLRYVALAAIASCALTVTVAVVLVRHRIAQQQATALATQASLIATTGIPASSQSPGDHVYRVTNGTVHLVRPALANAVLQAIPPNATADGTITVARHSLRYVARPTSAGRIVLIRAASLAFAEWRPFLASLILAGLGGALLAVVLSYLLARRLTRPLRELSAATRRLASGDEEVVVPVQGGDELGDLAISFNRMSGELSRAREAQRSFLESVSHELKTPLTSIRGYAEALGEEAVPAPDAARVITAEADRLERLVADLLDLARFGREGFVVDREPVDLDAVAAQALERHLPRAREMQVQLSCSSAGEAWALGDEQRILQATSNLVENALRLTPPGGSVVISVGPGEVSVRDSGPGLGDEDLSRAFDRFYLHRRYRGELTVGSGVGLAIVRELVSAMHGSVEAANAPGGGAIFTMRLTTPARSALPDAARPSA